MRPLWSKLLPGFPFDIVKRKRGKVQFFGKVHFKEEEPHFKRPGKAGKFLTTQYWLK